MLEKVVMIAIILEEMDVIHIVNLKTGLYAVEVCLVQDVEMGLLILHSEKYVMMQTPLMMMDVITNASSESLPTVEMVSSTQMNNAMMATIIQVMVAVLLVESSLNSFVSKLVQPPNAPCVETEKLIPDKYVMMEM